MRPSLFHGFALLLLGSLSLFAAVPQTTPHPSLVLHGTLTYADFHAFKMIPFHVPPGVKRITVDIAFTGMKERKAAVFPGIFDPNGFRGYGRTHFTISTVDATPPFLPGAIPAGKWGLLLGVDDIAKGYVSHWTAEIHFMNSVDGVSSPTDALPVLNPKPGWYRGDLHSHTGHSDGVCNSQSGHPVPCPAFKLMEAAAARKLDFLAITDHNTTSTYNDMMEAQPYFDKLLLIDGREMTTFGGHFNVWGTKSFVDFRTGYKGLTVNDFFDQAHAHGGLVSINHNWWPYDERCMGCGWAEKPNTDFRKVDAIEVINGYNQKGSWFKPPPGNGTPMWEEELAKGLRITAVGGSDDHRSGEQLPDDGVGRPTDVVYAPELSERGILDGIKAGHVYIKVFGPDGPDVFLNATTPSGKGQMGDNLSCPSGATANFTVEVKGGDAGIIHVLDNGKLSSLLASTTVQGADDSKSFAVHCDGSRHWIRIELYKPASTLVTLTNPIYLNFPERHSSRK